MNKDAHLIFESYIDNLSKTKKELGSNIMRMVKYGLPDESKIPELKERLISIFTDVKKAGGHVTPQQSVEAKQLVNQLRNSGLPEDELRNLYRHAPTENSEDYADQRKTKFDQAMDKYKDRENERDEKIKDAEENAEELNVSKYKDIITDMSKGGFDTSSKKLQVDKGVEEGIFDVETIQGKRQVVLTDKAVQAIENTYPELKGKFWSCGRCKADYAGCTQDKHKHSEDAEMPAKEFEKLKLHINKGPVQIKKLSKELPYTHQYIHSLAKKDPREEHLNRDENAEQKPGWGPYDDIDVEFVHNGLRFRAFGDVKFDENDPYGRGEVDNLSVVNIASGEEVTSEELREYAKGLIFNKAVDMSAEK